MPAARREWRRIASVEGEEAAEEHSKALEAKRAAESKAPPRKEWATFYPRIMWSSDLEMVEIQWRIRGMGEASAVLHPEDINKIYVSRSLSLQSQIIVIESCISFVKQVPEKENGHISLDVKKQVCRNFLRDNVPSNVKGRYLHIYCKKYKNKTVKWTEFVDFMRSWKCERRPVETMTPDMVEKRTQLDEKIAHPFVGKISKRGLHTGATISDFKEYADEVLEENGQYETLEQSSDRVLNKKIYYGPRDADRQEIAMRRMLRMMQDRKK
jgi:hypothetical protein